MAEELVIRALRDPAEAEICAQAMSESEPWITLRFDYDLTLKSLTDPTREAYVGTLGHRIAGFILLNLVGPFRGYVQFLCVLPEYRKQKIGRKLVQFAEERVFREVPNVFLCVSSFNQDALRFYEQAGYSKVGEIPDYVVAGHSEFLMRKTRGPMMGYGKN